MSVDLATVLAAALRDAPTPRLALRPEEAAAALGVSPESFARHVAPELRAVRRGRLRLYPVRELEAWLDREAARWDER